MKKISILIALILLVAAAVAFSFASGSRHSPQAPGMTVNAVATNKVTIKDYMFEPMVIKVKAGTTVTWTNTDSVNHTVTADNPSSSAPSSMDIAQGSSYSFTFLHPGTYSYHCFPHPYMHGTVVVE